jgi:hypothetical protein
VIAPKNSSNGSMCKRFVVHVSGVRRRLWTSATNGPVVYPPVIHEHGEPWWNWYWQRRPKNLERNLSQCHSLQHKSHIDWLGHEPGSVVRG